MEKPQAVKTYLGDMLILPKMVGNIVGVYNDETFIQVQINPGMIGRYLGKFSYHLQAYEAQPAWHWSHSLIPLHPSQVSSLPRQ